MTGADHILCLRTEVRGQMTEDRRQRAEVRPKGTEVGDWKDEGQTALAAVERSEAQGAIVKLFFFGNL